MNMSVNEKFGLFVILVLLLVVGWALLNMPVYAQHLLADPWAPADAPDGATYTYSTGAPVTCQLKPVVGGTQLDCDLASIPNGTYSGSLTITKNPTCTNPIPGVEGNCTSYTPGVSPWKYTVAKKPVGAPTNLRLSGP